VDVPDAGVDDEDGDGGADEWMGYNPELTAELGFSLSSSSSSLDDYARPPASEVSTSAASTSMMTLGWERSAAAAAAAVSMPVSSPLRPPPNLQRSRSVGAILLAEVLPNNNPRT
jgi:hypothetical protein